MHATRDAAIFLRPAKSTGANRSFFAFEKLPIKAESAREGEVNTIGALWSVNRATLRHNYSFWQLPFPVALMARYCMHEEITPCEYNIALEGERERRKRGEIYETKYQIENMKTITNSSTRQPRVARCNSYDGRLQRRRIVCRLNRPR